MTEEVIKNYLEHHFEANPNDNFKTEYGDLKSQGDCLVSRLSVANLSNLPAFSGLFIRLQGMIGKGYRRGADTNRSFS